jgi:hypothetical protein
MLPKMIPIITTKNGLIINGLVAEYKMKQKNLLKYSENLNDSTWTNTGSCVIEGNKIDPIGGTAAWLLNDNNATVNSGIKGNISVSLDSLTRTVTLYLKNIDAIETQITVAYNGGTGVAAYPTITWATLAIRNTGTNPYSLTNIGDGWYKFTYTLTNNNTNNNFYFTIYPGGWISGGANVGSIYVAFPQIELGDTSTAYEKTLDNQTLWNEKKSLYSVTNTIPNGDFSSSTGFTPANSTLSYADNTCFVTGNGGNARASIVRNDAGVLDISHVYYTRMKVKVTNSACAAIRISYDGSDTGANKLIATLSNPVQDTVYTLSCVGTPPADATGTFKVILDHGYADEATANGKVMEVQEWLCIDLTTMALDYTTVQADIMFPNWFGGTQSIWLPNYNGTLGSTENIDVNDPFLTGRSLSFDGGDYVKFPLLLNTENDYAIYLVINISDVVPISSEYYFGVGNSASNIQFMGLTRRTTGDLWFFLTDDSGSFMSAQLLATDVVDGIRLIKIQRQDNCVSIKDIGSSIQVVSEITIGVSSFNQMSLGCVLRTTAISYLNQPEYYALFYNRATTDKEDKQTYKYIKNELVKVGVQLG